jgi:hypothetical protein
VGEPSFLRCGIGALSGLTVQERSAARDLPELLGESIIVLARRFWGISLNTDGCVSEFSGYCRRHKKIGAIRNGSFHGKGLWKLVSDMSGFAEEADTAHRILFIPDVRFVIV